MTETQLKKTMNHDGRCRLRLRINLLLKKEGEKKFFPALFNLLFSSSGEREKEREKERGKRERERKKERRKREGKEREKTKHFVSRRHSSTFFQFFFLKINFDKQTF